MQLLSSALVPELWQFELHEEFLDLAFLQCQEIRDELFLLIVGEPTSRRAAATLVAA